MDVPKICFREIARKVLDCDLSLDFYLFDHISNSHAQPVQRILDNTTCKDERFVPKPCFNFFQPTLIVLTEVEHIKYETNIRVQELRHRTRILL